MNHKTQDTDTLVHNDEWIDDEDRALSDDDTFADDDQPGDEPPARSRRRKVPPLAIGLSAVVIAGLGFIGGVQVQKRSGDDAAGGMPAGMAAMVQAGGPGGAGAGAARGGTAGGSGGTSSSATTGEVANVKGSKVYVTTADGSTVEVAVGKTATVQRLASADADEIRPGDTVVVTGTAADDGSVKATAVQAAASGVRLLGGMGGRGRAVGGGPESGAAPSPTGSDGSGSGSGGSASSSSEGTAADDAAVDQLFESGD